MRNQQKAYFINYNTYYLNLDDFYSHLDFSNYMYNFLNAYAEEEFDVNETEYDILHIRLHNYEYDLAMVYLYPYVNKTLVQEFNSIYKESIVNDTRFLIIEIEYMDETELNDGSLLYNFNYSDEN